MSLFPATNAVDLQKQLKDKDDEISALRRQLENETDPLLKAKKFLKERNEEMVQLAQYYCSFDKRGGCNEFWKTLLESFGLEKFADSSKPIGIPSNNIIENGNKDWMWNLRTSESMYFDNKTKV